MFRKATQRLLCAAMLCAVSAAGCVRQLPRAATPDAAAPVLQTTEPPADGLARLVVDVVDGPTLVQQVRMEATQTTDLQGRVRFRFHESPTPLCAASPCVLDMPAGNVLLGFPVAGKRNAMEIELVHLGVEPSVYRRSLSRYQGSTGALNVVGIVAASLGATSAITGVALLPIGLSRGNDGLATAGGITLVVGAALVAAGVWAIRRDAPTYRPGSSIHFPL